MSKDKFCKVREALEIKKLKREIVELNARMAERTIKMLDDNAKLILKLQKYEQRPTR